MTLRTIVDRIRLSWQAVATRVSLERVFVLVTVALVIGYFVAAAIEIQHNLSLDPTGYSCTQDSMMMNFCQHPYYMGFMWAALVLVVIAWPIVLGWAALAVAVSLRYVQRRHRK